MLVARAFHLKGHSPGEKPRLPFRANSIDADARLTSLHPPGNAEVCGQIPARARRQVQAGAKASDPQIAKRRWHARMRFVANAMAHPVYRRATDAIVNSIAFVASTVTEPPG